MTRDLQTQPNYAHPEPTHLRSRTRALLSGTMAGALVATGLVALAPSATQAAVVDPSAVTFQADLGGGVFAVDVAVYAAGAPGGGCSPASGGTAAVIEGTIAGLSESDTISATVGTRGVACDQGGTGGAGAYNGGNGGDGTSVAFPPLLTAPGGGGGGSTAVMLGGSEIVVAGGGGGAGGLAFTNATIPQTLLGGGDGGAADEVGSPGGGGDDTDGGSGAGGTPGSEPSGDGVAGADATGAGTSGGGGGGGGGSNGGQAATGGSAASDELASGGGGAGGASLATNRATSPEIATAASVEVEPAAELVYVDITAGSVGNADVGGTYSGTTFTSDDPSSWSTLTWGTSGTVPAGLVIDPDTGAVSGSVTAAPGSYSFAVTATADIAEGPLATRTVVSKKNITLQVTGSGDVIEPPLRPKALTVINKPKSKNVKFTWGAPNDPGNRPVDGYRLLINQRGFPPLLVNQKLPSAQTSFKIRKKYLLRLSAQARGDAGKYVFYRLRVFAENESGNGLIAKRFFAIKLR